MRLRRLTRIWGALGSERCTTYIRRASKIHGKFKISLTKCHHYSFQRNNELQANKHPLSSLHECAYDVGRANL